MSDISIGGRAIRRDAEPFIILEAGINHNGQLDLALEMIRTAKAVGADAVKFQTFTAEEFVGDPNLTYTYRSQGEEITESQLALFKRHEFTRDQWRTLKKACDDSGIQFLSTPQNPSDLRLLVDIGVPAVKIGSDDFTNVPLLTEYAATGLPLIMSCGMADMDEVSRSLDAVGTARGYPTILLVCTSQYPTPPQDANIARVTTLLSAFPQAVIGFSDHTESSVAAIMAVGLGAVVFEKHFTMSRDLPGPDHWFSEDPKSAADWVASIRSAHVMRGTGAVRPS